MRVNLARAASGMQAKFLKEYIRTFAFEYEFSSLQAAISYVRTGRQGLTAFVDYLNLCGFKAKLYALPPNKDLFFDVGEEWVKTSRSSPSFGFCILDTDPLLVEFKLKLP